MSKRKNRTKKPHHEVDQNYEADELIRLNKYIAHSGFTSRRKADNYIEAGKVKVNGEVVTKLGTKVKRRDQVEIDGENLQLERFTYILLNKPKNTISTVKDTGDRTTVLNVVEEATNKRIYPVGRLDRNTTGVIILTNDGDLANRLMHPSYGVRKLYEVRTERPLTGEEMQQLRDGIHIKGGYNVNAYHVERIPDDFSTLGIGIKEGRNRQIRRMMEALGTEVKAMKRVDYAGLNLEGLDIGDWRYLKRNEINELRMLVGLETLDFQHNA